jgi:glyoxylase-like metal-dependent hydrolase (beta-lactamase superfamily II)
MQAESTLAAQNTNEQRLAASTDMEPVQGTVDVDVPIDIFWECFRSANFWPRWNKCFFWAHNRDLALGKQLIWAFQPIKPWYLYKMWAIAKIVELEKQRKVTWEVTAFPGMYARHTYHVEDLGNGRTRFGSWEKATGWGFNIIKKFWIAHFTFVKDRSLEGATTLANQYKQTGRLAPEALPRKTRAFFWLAALIVALLVGGTYWFYSSFMRETAVALAPGVHAVIGGGGNSLVVENGGDVLLIDTKFPPGSNWLRSWISSNVKSPVTEIVNTHYHYDHTQGNSLYPGARKIAHERVPALMQAYDSDWWVKHASGVPTDLMSDAGGTIQVGSKRVLLFHPSPAHTAGDLWAYLPDDNIVATGDLVFNRYYPFMDQPEGGTSIAGIIKAARKLASDYPTARFLPGHGPMATAADLNRYADYLELLSSSVRRAQHEQRSEQRAASEIDLSRWNLSILPSFHHNRIIWATASNNIRWAYRLESTTGGNQL